MFMQLKASWSQVLRCPPLRVPCLPARDTKGRLPVVAGTQPGHVRCAPSRQCCPAPKTP